MSLYKYCNSNGKLIVQNLQIKVCPPNKLNDPCEMRPVVKTSDHNEAAKQTAKRAVVHPSFYNHHRHEFPKYKNFSKFQKFARANMGIMIRALEENTERLEHQLRDDIPEILSEQFGIISFSKELFSNLMWAHYGDSHKGLVVEFDEKNELFSGPGFLECEYVDEPAVYDPIHRESREQVVAFSRRKHSDWSYEKESRLIVPLEVCRKQTVGGGILQLLPLESEIIVSVTFGLRASESLQADVKKALEKPNLQHVKLWRITENGQPGNYLREPLG